MTTKEPLQLVDEIDDLLREIWEHLENPELLSFDILRLAVKSGGLGTHLIEAEFDMDQAESQYKYQVDKRKLELVKQGESATVSESTAKVELQEDYSAYLERKKAYKAIKIKREDTDRAIDAVRSRLSLVKTDLRRD